MYLARAPNGVTGGVDSALKTNISFQVEPGSPLNNTAVMLKSERLENSANVLKTIRTNILRNKTVLKKKEDVAM